MRWTALLLALVVSAPAMAGGVKVEVGPDGRKVFTNLGDTTSRRTPSLGRSMPRSAVEPWVETSAEVFDLDPELVHAVIRAESGYNPRAVSVKGAMGLMQLMPQTAKLLKVEDPYDPAANIAGGARYLRTLLDRFEGSLELALAGYNAGPEAVRRFGGIPPFAETRRYVERVLREYRGDSSYTVPAATTVPKRVPRGRSVRLSRDAYGRAVISTSTGG